MDIDRQYAAALRDAAERNADIIVRATEDDADDVRRKAKQEAQQIRDEAQRDRQNDGREATAAEEFGRRIEVATSNLDMAAEAARDGTHDEPITCEHLADETEFEVLCRHAPEGRPTRGFWYRFWSLNDPRTGMPLSMPERIRAGFERAFDVVAGLARRMAAIGRREAAHEQKVQTWNAGREERERTLDAARKAGERLTEARTATTDAEARRDEAEADRDAARRALDAAGDAEARRDDALRERDEARDEVGRLRGALAPLRRIWDALHVHDRAVAELEADRSRPRPQDLEAARAWLERARGRNPHDSRLFEIFAHVMRLEGWQRFGLDELLGAGRRGDDPRVVFDDLKRLGLREHNQLSSIYRQAELANVRPCPPDPGELLQRVALAFRHDDPDGDRVALPDLPPEAAILRALSEPLRRDLDEAREAERAHDEPPRPPRPRP